MSDVWDVLTMHFEHEDEFEILAMLKNCTRTKAMFWAVLLSVRANTWAFNASNGFDFERLDCALLQSVPDGTSFDAKWLVMNWKQWVPQVWCDV